MLNINRLCPDFVKDVTRVGLNATPQAGRPALLDLVLKCYIRKHICIVQTGRPEGSDARFGEIKCHANPPKYRVAQNIGKQVLGD